MNSKKIIFSIFVIFAIIFMTANVLAANTGPKGERPEYCNTEDITDLKIISASAIKYTVDQNKDYCAVVTVKTNYYSYTDNKEYALGIIVVGDSVDSFRSKYAKIMEKIYVDGPNNKKASGCSKISNYDSIFDNGQVCSPSKANLSTNIITFKHGDNFCKAKVFDVYVFKPWKVGFKFQNNAYICGVGTDKKDSRNLGASSSKLWQQDNSFFSETYFYNIDYYYNAEIKQPVINYSNLAIERPITIKEDSTKCTDSNYPFLLDFNITGREANLTRYYAVSGPNTFNSDKENILKFIYDFTAKGEISKKINYIKESTTNQIKADADKFTAVAWTEEDSDKYSTTLYFCLSKNFKEKQVNLFAWQYKDGDYANLGPTGNYSFEEFKSNYNTAVNKEFSVSENNNVSASGDNGGSTSGNEESGAVSNNNATTNTGTQDLEFNLFPTIYEIIYNTSNSWSKAKKINEPESFLIDYKASTKKVIVNLSNLDLKYKVYAIITTPDKVNEIDTELNKIYNNKINNEYILQNNYTINNSFTTDNIDKISFRLDLKKSFLFNIEKDITPDKLVLIFMQITEDNLINITYANLYLLENNAQSTYQLCEANKRILDLFCTGHNCINSKPCLERWDFDESKLVREKRPENQNLPDDTTTISQVPSYNFTSKCSIIKQKTVDEYINCLKNNLIILPLNKYYKINNYDPHAGVYVNVGGYGSDLVNAKYSADSRVCFGDSRENFNKIIFSVAKKEGLSEEETAQLWSKLAAESGCSLTCEGAGGCHGDGIGQVTEAWHGENEYIRLKKYLLEINPEKYKNYAAYYNVITNQDRDAVSATELALALSRYNFNNAVRDSKNAKTPITIEMITMYDNDNAINASTIGAYLHGNTAFKFKNGINPIAVNSWGYTALHKLGYYLAYKRAIYNCYNENTTNSFVDAYKTEYGGIYCDKTNLSNNTISTNNYVVLADNKYNTFSQTPLVTGEEIVEYAKKYVGYKYVWGGNCLKKGVDCSGFVREVYSHFGIEIKPRTAKYQSYCGAEVKSLEDAQPGDVIALSNNKKLDGIHHIIIYAGKDSAGNVMIVHAKGTQYGIKYEKISTTYIQEIYSIRRFVNVKVCKNTPVDAPLARTPVCFLN